MRRRDFIAGIVVTTGVGLAQAQQKPKVYRLALAHPATPAASLTETREASRIYGPFFRRLRELGYVEGQNLAVERYSGEGRTENFAELVAEVIRNKPDVIYTVSARLTRDFKAATHTIPIVAFVADPVAEGIVPSLARPGGNITGTTVDAGVEMWSKRLGLLREVIPAASKVGFLASRRVWDSPDGAAAREVAQRINISLVGPPLSTPLDEWEYRRVIAAMAQDGADALVVGDQAEHNTNSRLIVMVAEQARLPAIYPYRYFASIGGLIAYGIDFSDVMHHLAEQIDQILMGTKPGDIPFYQPTKFELAINVKAAKVLGLRLPDSLLAQADEVIE